MYNSQQQPTDIHAYLARIQSQLASKQAPEESPVFRDARLYYKHGLNNLEDPNGPNPDAPTGLARLYGQGTALRSAAKNAVSSTVASL